MMILHCLFLFLCLCVISSHAFSPHSTSRRVRQQRRQVPAVSSSSSSSSSSSVALHAATTNAITEQRRKKLLSRDGPYFNLNRMGGGQIEFGATVDLVTELDSKADNGDDDDDSSSIATWLRDERGIALSIWDEDLIEEKENDIYRLQVMTLKFVTLQLAPCVDLHMKTLTAQSVKDPSRIFPVFRLQSVDFDPNVQILPGMRVTAESLGIVIHVVGELRPTQDGKGVTGKISFATQGILPPPLLLVPDGALKAASDSINQTVVDFAVKSFQKGVKKKYEEFRQAQLQAQEASSS